MRPTGEDSRAAYSALSWAKAYARRGYNVFPLRAGTKRPDGALVPNGVLNATTDHGSLEKWFDVAHPAPGIGMAMGEKSGLVAVDVDGEEGLATIRQIEQAHGELPTTLVSNTQGGGMHYLFRYRPGLRNTVRRLPGIDVRTDNGYIVVAPTTIEGGGAYEWDAEGHPSDVAEAAAMPDWLYSLLAKPADEKPKNRTRPQTSEDVLRNKHEALRAMRRLGPEAADDYETWLQVGQALHAIDSDDTTLLELWEAWSQQSDKCEEGDCWKRWRGFTPDRGITIASIIHFARSSDGPPWVDAVAAPDSWGDEPPSQDWAVTIGKAPPEDCWPSDELQGDGKAWRGVLDMTDHGNALRLAWQLRDRVRCIVGITEDRCWMLWDGRVWRQGSEATAEVRRLCRDAIHVGRDWVDAERRREADSEGREHKTDTSFNRKVGSKAALDNAMALLSIHEEITVAADQIDANAHLLNVANGIVDLRTGALLDHDPKHLMSHICPVPYEPAATSAAWQTWKEQISCMDAALEDAMEVGLGASLFGSHWSKGFFLSGPTGTGKSTLFRAVEAVLGGGALGYAQAVEWDTIGETPGRSRGNHDAGLSSLQGKRFAYVSEAPDNGAFGNRYKTLTGDQSIIFRAPYGRSMETLRCTSSIWLAANKRPNVPASEGGASVMRRLVIIPFEQQFSDDAAKLQCDGSRYIEINPALVARFVHEDGTPGPEAPGVLAALVRGAERWWRERQIPQSARMEKVREDFTEDQLPELELFLNDCVALVENGWTSRDALYQTYRGWAEEQGIRKPYKNAGRFSLGAQLGECVRNSDRYGGDQIQQHKNQPRPMENGRRQKGWGGIELTPVGGDFRLRGKRLLGRSTDDQSQGWEATL